MTRRKRKPPESIFIRLYPDREEDQAVIAWLDQNVPADVHGARQQAIKAALLRGIHGENTATESSSPAAIDWVMLRQVIDSALASGLARMQIAPTHLQPPDEADTGSKVDIAGLMGTWNADDDDE